MGTLTNERRILREAYLRADDALSHLDTLLGKEEEDWISDTAEIYRTWKDRPEEANIRIREHLRFKPPSLIDIQTITNALTDVLVGLHLTGNGLYDLALTTEHTIEEVNLAVISTTQEQRSRDARQPDHRQSLRLPETLDGLESDGGRGHRDRPHPDQGASGTTDDEYP